MRKALLAIAMVGVVGLSAKPVEAQAKAGDNEVSFLASYFKQTKGDSDGFLSANARLGHFYTDALEVGAGISIAGSLDDIDKSTNLEIFGLYLFSPGAVHTWYARAGYFFPVDEPGDGFLDGAFGFRAYLDEDKAFFWEAAYGYAISSDVDGGAIRSLAGLTFVF